MKLTNHNAQWAGSAHLTAQGPLWVTGHQAWLWHAGILAKDIAAAVAARDHGGQVLHLVVDHDVHEALSLPIPVAEGDALTIQTHQLARTRTALPAACQSAADLSQALATLKRLTADDGLHTPARFDALQAAMRDLPAFDTLGQQMAAITVRLMQPVLGSVAIALTSQLCALPGFKQIIREMLHDARACAAAYNQAVQAHPQAGIGPLAVSDLLVELPLWLLTWEGGRQPVYADLADSTPLLVTADGQPVKVGEAYDQPRLAPRAMLLTAAMRQLYASVFIHGTGGGVYDRVTEAWWQAWRPDETLAPMAVVTADLRFDFDAPIATLDNVRQAQWWMHHLPHNLDRHADLPEEARALAKRKAACLARMDDDRDPARRQKLFQEIHGINDQLAALMPQPLDAAQMNLDNARIGVDNQAIARKRDWCFALHPPEQLSQLAQALGLTDQRGP